jgi:hypothetical protein
MKGPPFDKEDEREKLAHRLSNVGVTIPKDALRKRPTFPLKLLIEPGSLDKFLSAFDWMLSEIKEVESYDDAHEPGSVGPIQET